MPHPMLLHRRVANQPVSIACLVVLVCALLSLAACGGSPGGSTATHTAGHATPSRVPSSAPSASAIEPFSSPQPQPSVAAVAPTRCESFANNAYTSREWGFTIPCPAGFAWETFGSSYSGSSLRFAYRMVEAPYLGNYPPGQIEMHLYGEGVGNLRTWIAGHLGPPMSSSAAVYWDFTTNLTDTTVAGAPAVSFDYTLQGPEAPPLVHAVAFVIGPNLVLVLGWWAYQSSYSSSIAPVAQRVVAGIRIQ